MGERPPGRHTYLGVLAVSVALFGTAVVATRAIRAVVRLVVGFLGRWVPATTARVTGVAAVVVLLAGVGHGVVYDGLLGLAHDASASFNTGNPPGVSAPASTLRSGGPGSLVTWQSLGLQGRAFVSGGPSAAALSRFSGTPARQPIRAYVGLDGRRGLRDEAMLAVRELQRMDAFSRKVLCVVTTTGTGWVDPYAADALEYLHNGDTAIVGMQYSYLPSWISFMTERDRVAEAGRELFDQVHAAWSALPPGRRPKLLVFGESLGSLGSEAAFSGVDDIRNRTDGALWIGPTNANSLWARFVADRDPGSPQTVPTYRHGLTVRFAAEVSDLERPVNAWSTPRAVYLQHASDPVVCATPTPPRSRSGPRYAC